MAITRLMGRLSALTLQAVCFAGLLSERQADVYEISPRIQQKGDTSLRQLTLCGKAKRFRSSSSRSFAPSDFCLIPDE